jgi:vacuolar-type H+-ATPase subunit F/Vma7
VKLVVLGDFDDVCGFELAGVDGVVVSGSSLEAALSRSKARGDVALVLVSGSVARDAPAVIERALGWSEPPFVFVLPDRSAPGDREVPS